MVDDHNFERLNQFVWHDNGTGHIRRCKNGHRTKKVAMSNEVLQIDGVKIDHKDRNGYNNLESNLRISNRSLNAANTDKRSTKCTSKYKGVSWSKRDKKWIGRACKDYKIITRSFDTEIEAALYYNELATKLFGEFAVLNKIEQ